MPLDNHRNYGSLPLDQRNVIDTSAARLEREFDGTFARETIERYIADSFDRLIARASFDRYVPILTERFARQRLTALAKADGISPAIGSRCTPEVRSPRPLST